MIEDRDIVAYSKPDFEFHATVYDACGGERLKELLENIKNMMHPLTLHMQPDFPKLIENHPELLQALRGRGPEEAEREFGRHNQCMTAQIQEDVNAGRRKQFGRRRHRVPPSLLGYSYTSTDAEGYSHEVAGRQNSHCSH